MADINIKRTQKYATQKEIQFDGNLQFRVLGILDTTPPTVEVRFELVNKDGQVFVTYESAILPQDGTMLIEIPVTETVIITEYEK